MNQIEQGSAALSKDAILRRTQELFLEQQNRIHRNTDRSFAWLMGFQWICCIIIAVSVSPVAWAGMQSTIHLHVLAAIFVGGAISLFPVTLAITNPGKTFTRHIIAVSQILMSALLIHLSGGRIETHFHVFGSLAFLAFYRDWKVVLTASLVVALDHVVRGVFWPFSVYGVLDVEPLRWIEHAGWVVFEDVFLAISIKQSLHSSYDLALRQAELEKINEVIEGRVKERTAELEIEVAERTQAQNELAATNVLLEGLSKDLERSRDQAVQASKFKSEFLANMSHEIRTPLNAMVGMSDLLVRTHLTDEQREFGMVINNSADVLLGIVNDILDYSKIESGRLDLEIIDFDLVEMVEGAAELLAERARSKHLSLATYIDSTIPRIVRGDPGRIRQVLLNFLSNSIKFTDRGEIIIRVVRSISESGKPAMHFSVVDTGIGLNDAACERLFQPFTQADSSITRRYGGTGLGLAISKRLIELMGGTIRYKSTYGEGAEFGFVIDIETSNSDQPPPLIPSADVNNARILLVDGPAGTQQVLNTYVASWGMRCSTASDVDKALLMMRREAAANDAFDLVMVAFELDGAEQKKLISEVKNHSQIASTKFIAVGSALDRQTGNRAKKNGFAAFLSLPVRQSKLFDCIINLLNQDDPEDPTLEELQIELETTQAQEPEPRNLVLVVEDNPTNQKVALLQLRELGLAAHAVGNGREALEAVARTQYALILMDCQMPEMDGIQATKEIRKMEALTGRHSPIVAMTAHALSSDRLECLAAGMDDYISKPVNQKRLTEVIDRWLPRAISLSTKSQFPIEDQHKKPVELDVLFSTFGKPIAESLLQDFLIQAEEHVARLDKAVRAEDLTVVKQMVHDLKGESATLFATELANVSCSLEEYARGQTISWKEMAIRYAALEKAWLRLKECIEETGVSSKDMASREVSSPDGED